MTKRFSALSVALFLFTPLLSGINACNTDDADGDGWTVEQGDCNDSDVQIHPGAAEVCDGQDSNCDGQVDETTLYFVDADADGFGSSSAPIETCNPPSGAVKEGGDCDDLNAVDHPEASERCDGRDNDCDGAVDEGFDLRYYLDGDKDGFGAETHVVCIATTGYAAARGDCDDTKASVHPGATDPTGDGADQDCGGADGPQPHVGLSSSSLATLQQALDRATAGSTVWVGPGTRLEHSLRFPSVDFQLRSTGLAARTTLDAQKQGRVFTLEPGHGSGMRIDGFTFTGGFTTENGGGAYISGTQATLENCIFRNNLTEPGNERPGDRGLGGGLYVHSSTLLLRDVMFEQNLVVEGVDQVCDDVNTDPCHDEYYGGHGGGLAAVSSTLTVKGCRFVANQATGEITEGGGFHTNAGTYELTGNDFSNNFARRGGGYFQSEGTATITASKVTANSQSAVVIRGGKATVEHSEFRKNRSDLYSGGAVHFSAAEGKIAHCRFFDNVAERNTNGGAFGVSSTAISPITIQNSLFQGNTSDGWGGAVYTEGQISLENVTIVDNFAALGGAVGAFYDCNVAIRSSILHNNPGYNLYFRNQDQGGCPGSIAYTNFSNAYGQHYNFSDQNVQLLAGTITDDLPSFVRLSHNQNTDDDDFHLLLGSSLRDIGDPKTADEDGTRTELGAYGASVSAQRYYQDQDRDGMYDGWEKSMGLSPTTADGGLDLDGDGMSNSNEHIRHTWANRPDSDGDGVSDGAEYSGGSDPLNWYARPSGTPNATEEKRVTATVPGDFSTLTAAVNAIQDRGEILIQPGQYQEQLLIRSKAVTLESASPGISPILDWPYDTLLSLGGGELTLTGLTLTQEGCQSYAHPVSTSLRLMYASARLNDVRLEENCGSSGEYRTFGAAHFDQSDVVAQHFEVISSVGIGLSTTDSTVELEDCTIADNARAGLLADAFSDVSLYNCVVGGNRGSGIATNIPQFLTVRNSLIINNSSTSSGGGVYIPANGEKDTALFSHVLFAGNVSGYRGGGAYQYLSQVTYDHCVFTQNSAYKGDGGLSVAGSALTLVNVSNSILANNEGYNILISLGNDTPGDGLPRANISNSILYNPPGSLNYSLGNTPLNPSNLTDNPGFLEIDAQGVAVDYHLSLDSPAINRGNGTEVDLDGSLSDIGLYGGPGAASFDLDFDGRPDYFWPGGYSAVPTGVLGSDYDPDDRDPMR